MDHRGKDLLLAAFLLALATTIEMIDAKPKACSDSEITYEFTECDSSEGRWRVAVPNKVGSCDATSKPVRQKDCTYTCDPGKYVDVNSATLECKDCVAGTYSVGGGVRFTDWRKLPTGFESRSVDVEYRDMGYDGEFAREKSGNCSGLGWIPKGDSISSSGDECTSELTYAVTLKRDGHVKFVYHFPDDMYTVFRFYVRNDQCKLSSHDKSQIYLAETGENEWKTREIKLKAGRNLLTFEATAITYGSHEKRDPIHIKSIEIQGAAFTTECTPCEPGSYSDKASANCKLCPENHFSGSGATKCSKCNEVTEYSTRGSANCTTRKLCTEQDYYDTRTTCDSNHQTQVMFKWIEPKICREDVDGAKKLPASGGKEKCPPCNPGMFLNGTQCLYCPANQFSDGSADCKKCPVSTEASYGYDLKWWRSIPPNMKPSCFSISDRGCTTTQGWQPHGTFIDSGINHADGVYLVLRLDVGGFGHLQHMAGGREGFGTVSFVFEMECEGKCLLKFKEDSWNGVKVIEQWSGKRGKDKYTYIVSSSSKRSFMWTFQKVQNQDEFGINSVVSYQHRLDRVKIHSINITNTIDGGAAMCKECPVKSNKKGDTGCQSCPDGNYINVKEHKCVKCPKDHYLNSTNLYSKDACIPCGPGLTSEEGSTSCHSDCTFASRKYLGREFDFKALAGPQSVEGGSSFTSRGSRYFHVFNFSICGHPPKPATCHSNISVRTGYRDSENLTAPVCRVTIIPNSYNHLPLATQPMSLGEQLVGIYEDEEELIGNTSSTFVDSGEISNMTTHFIFKYQSNSVTVACPNGRTVWVTLKCDNNADKGRILLPPKCPDGTCDGCKFEFLWRTKYACPECREKDINKVEAACKHGKKTIHYMWKQPKNCRDGVKLQEPMDEKCSIFEQTVGSAVMDFKIVLSVAALCLVLLVLSIFGLWYKNRRLTYKYSRLIQQSDDGRPCELPQAERCVVDDDEEEEEEVHFRKSSAKDAGKKILKKLKEAASGAGKKKSHKVTFDDEEDDEYFESVQLEGAKESLVGPQV